MDGPRLLASNKTRRFWGIDLDKPADAANVPELLIDWPPWRVRALADDIARLLAMTQGEREELRRLPYRRPAEPRDWSDEVLRLTAEDREDGP